MSKQKARKSSVSNVAIDAALAAKGEYQDRERRFWRDAAVHEAGHAVASLSVGRPVDLVRRTIGVSEADCVGIEVRAVSRK